MAINNFTEAERWFRDNQVKLYGFLRHSGDRLAVRLADYGSRGDQQARLVRQIGDLFHVFYTTRGSSFVRAHVLPLVAKSAGASHEPAHAAGLLLAELTELRRRPVPVSFGGLTELEPHKVKDVGKAYALLVNRQQFFDPEAYGTHYHKDESHSLKKEEVIGRAGAELHGNVMASENGAFALIGDPRVGKGRISFLLAHLHGFPIVTDDRVHMIFSKTGAHVVGPYRKYGFRAASHFYMQGRRFYKGIFGDYKSPGFPAELKYFWHHGTNQEQLFKGKPVPSVDHAPLHANLEPANLRAVFLVDTHASEKTIVENASQEQIVRYIAKRQDVGVPTVFGYPQTYPLETPLSIEERRQIADALVSKLAQKGVRFYRVLVPQDPKEVVRKAPSGGIRQGTPFDSRMQAAQEIARVMHPE